MPHQCPKSGTNNGPASPDPYHRVVLCSRRAENVPCHGPSGRYGPFGYLYLCPTPTWSDHTEPINQTFLTAQTQQKRHMHFTALGFLLLPCFRNPFLSACNCRPKSPRERRFILLLLGFHIWTTRERKSGGGVSLTKRSTTETE